MFAWADVSGIGENVKFVYIVLDNLYLLWHIVHYESPEPTRPRQNPQLPS